jgi:hypothetical protein
MIFEMPVASGSMRMCARRGQGLRFDDHSSSMLDALGCKAPCHSMVMVQTRYKAQKL